MQQGESFPWQRFAGPRYWPVWLGLALLRASTWLPYGMQRACAYLMGTLARPALGKRGKIAAINLEICFPELDARARGHLLRAHARALAMGLFEAAECWWGDAAKLRRRVTLEGIEHLETARREGRPVILLSGHFTTLELGGRLLGLFTDFHLMYRKHENPLLEEVIRRNRERHFDHAIPRDAARQMLKSLHRGHAVWYAPDQSYRKQQSTMAPFFGTPAPTTTATARIARITGARVLPFFVQRLPGNAGYQLEIGAALDGFPGGDDAADTARINRVIESQVLRAPEQYIWIHRRFKQAQPGGGEIYPR